MEYRNVTQEHTACRRDESRMEGTAAFLCFPAKTEELCEAVVWAREKGVSITVQGGRTGIVGGAVPSGGLVVCTERMNGITGLRRRSDGAYLLRVQAGATLGQVRDFLRRPQAPPDWARADRELLETLGRGPRLRFCPNPGEATACMGGLFATDAKGCNALRYGGVGGHIHSLSWAAPSGALWEIERDKFLFDDAGCPLPDGGRLDCRTDLPRGGLAALHPAPGRDLIDFLAGSEGTLGAAAELELVLLPEPPACWSVVYFFDEEMKMLAFACALAAWRDRSAQRELMSAAESLDAFCLKLLRENRPRSTALQQLPEIPAHARAALCVTLEGKELDQLEEALAEQLALFGDCGGHEEDTWAAADRAETERFETLRHSVPEMVNERVDVLRLEFPAFCKTACDCSGPPEKRETAYTRYHHDIRESGLEGYLFGHILENRMHVNLMAQRPGELARCREMIARWARQTVYEGGLAAGESGVGRARGALIRSLLDAERAEQLDTVKARFDPEGIFPSLLGRAAL